MKLTIIIVTFNHEKYIRQCIESVLSQELDFEWELIIACDYSTDNTLQIAEEYRNRFKNFTINAQQTNVGTGHNLADAIRLAKGELLAFIDGDDYNIDANKYAKQVDVFDNNPDVAICFGNGVRIIGELEKKEPFYNRIALERENFDLEFFYRKKVLANPTSLMWRRVSLPDHLPTFFYKYPNTDWMLISICGMKGNIFFLNELLACYRVHERSLLRSTPRINLLVDQRNLNRDMNKCQNYQYDYHFKNESWYDEQLAYEYLKAKNYLKALSSTVKYLTSRHYAGAPSLKYFMATIYNIILHY